MISAQNAITKASFNRSPTTGSLITSPRCARGLTTISCARNPPPYPHSVPSALIMRRDELMRQIMFVPFARPTARRAFSSPKRFAIQEYERVSPMGIDCKIFQARS